MLTKFHEMLLLGFVQILELCAFLSTLHAILCVLEFTDGIIAQSGCNCEAVTMSILHKAVERLYVMANASLLQASWQASSP